MTRLGTWVKRHFLSKSRPEKQPSENEKLPCLPSTRRPLTPTLIETPTCSFFELPGDIRSIILTMAFGGRTLHVDILRQNEAWQWRGAICYRNPPGRSPSMQYPWASPLDDDCPEHVRGRKGKAFDSYSVGIMGFLLSCRQAYTEGIQFLYSTNRISIQSERLLLQLPRLILPNRLASIKTLEIVIRVPRIRQESGGSSLNLNHLKPILDHIVTYCHGLRSIYLSFAGLIWGSGTLDGLALPLVDAFYQSTRLRDIVVELPPETYGAVICSRSLVDHPSEAPLMGRFPRSLWRSLDSEMPMVQRRSLECYPYPPLRFLAPSDENENIDSMGYWLSIGPEQSLRPYMVCF